MFKRHVINSSGIKRAKILILVSGSIAAIRIPSLVSYLIKENYEVKCVLTKNAENFIQPFSLSILSRNSCLLDEDQWNSKKSSPLHIELSNWADNIIMAPLTATTLSKWITGNAEGLVASILISNQKPTIVCPAMNTEMWNNYAVKRNYEKLKTYRNILPIEPSEGLLACDRLGTGKMAPNELINLALDFVCTQNKDCNFNDLSNKSFLITGGATFEKIDPARNITNNSSGAMGLYLAQIAKFRGANVTYIHGPLKIHSDLKEGIKTIEISTSEELVNLLRKEIDKYDYFFMNSAVTDIRLGNNNRQKIPKEELKNYFSENIELVPDILQEMSTFKRNNQVFLGFCAFTGCMENLRLIIQKKFSIKGCDFIFANPIDIDGQGFGFSSDNEGWLFDREGLEHHIVKTSKIDLANKLINKIISIDK